ncbi:MAG: hypothetical protein FJ123_03815 [Deltaproteobacteria bacterium]|nr:hypothetical protein [Deltaproteobacteria bacterium]
MNSVPSEWKTERLKNRVGFAYGDSLAVDDRIDGNVPVFGSNGVIGTHDRAITTGNTIIIGRKGSFGKVTWSDSSCFPIDTTYFVDRTQTWEHLRWLYYALQSLQLDTVNFDSAVPGLSREVAYSLRVSFPPPPEQERIAAYLDASCAAIDAAVAAKRRQLETLEALRKSTITHAVTCGLNPGVGMTTSGQDWLGDIPSQWTAPCLKRLLKEPLTYGLNEAAELEDRDLPRYLRITDFDDNGRLRNDTFRSLPREIACEAMLSSDDVLFARSGATVGKTFMFRNYKGEACFAGYLIRARTIPWKLSPLFLYYFTMTSTYEAWKNLIFTQATIQNISASKYNYLTIPLPQLPEQRKICDFVEDKNTAFQKLATYIERQIDTLIAYRKSLIHECITGQRRVTEADVERTRTIVHND